MPHTVRHVTDAASFQSLLIDLTGIEGGLSKEVNLAAQRIIDALGPARDVDALQIASEFYARLNQKLGANSDAVARLYALCAAENLTLNYPSKRRLEWAINTGNIPSLLSQLMSQNAGANLINRVKESVVPVAHAVTRQLLFIETTRPSKLRRLPDRDVANDVFNASAGPLAWSIWPPAQMARVFNSDPLPFSDDYMSDLRTHRPQMFERRRSLAVRQIQPEPSSAFSNQREHLTRWLETEYEALDNYGFVAVLINVPDGVEPEAWQLASDLPLFAERFYEIELTQPFFRSQDVRRETLRHSPDIDSDAAQFNILCEGFTYRDTFVLCDNDDKVRRLLIILQKNRRDETKVPCPACRSDHVGGNSYPSFGVKSWECLNPVCADRSIYNRGKRYDFRSLLKQEAIETDGNQISHASVRRWQRDVLHFESDAEILNTILAHYSMRGDVVALIDVKESPSDVLGRTVRIGEQPSVQVTKAEFWSGPFFARFIPNGTPSKAPHRSAFETDPAGWETRQGDAIDLLRNIPDSTFDRAVTSPPYYNAREYAQWPNLYCYMHDMYRISEEVFRTLKPGAIFAYNIFDYFDNERVVTFSDMGKKRILLSALMVDAFRRIGFMYLGSVVWDKGEIQGKRGFNAGNFSPFYQSPFNCWEHVLVVQKPGASPADDALGALPGINRVHRIHPVVKIVRGQNTHGHTAPYPIALVTALLAGLPPESLVLDPFGGSGTTAQGALTAGHRSVLLERNPSYVDLSRKLTSAHAYQLNGARRERTLF